MLACGRGRATTAAAAPAASAAAGCGQTRCCRRKEGAGQLPRLRSAAAAAAAWDAAEAGGGVVRRQARGPSLVVQLCDIELWERRKCHGSAQFRGGAPRSGRQAWPRALPVRATKPYAGQRMGCPPHGADSDIYSCSRQEAMHKN